MNKPGTICWLFLALLFIMQPLARAQNECPAGTNAWYNANDPAGALHPIVRFGGDGRPSLPFPNSIFQRTPNNIRFADQLLGANAGAKIAKCVADIATGGICDARGFTGAQAINQNIFAGATGCGKLLLGNATFTASAQQIVPSCWEIAGSGVGITIIKPTAGASWSSPEGIFINKAYNTYSPSSGHNNNISIHDLTIDGTGNTNVSGVSFLGADNSNLYNLYLLNIAHNGVDIRAGNGNVVHDSWCVNCFTSGSPWHAFGGGTVAATDIFRHNKFHHNHAVGGGAGGGGGDHFDIFGQAKSGYCEDTTFDHNTSDSSPSVGFFLDTCSRNTLTGNTARTPVTYGFALTSGTFNLNGGAQRNTLSNNITDTPGLSCVLLANESNYNTISGGQCSMAGRDGIVIQDANGNVINGGLQIIGPSQSAANTYSGVTISNTAVTNANQNEVSNVHFTDSGSKMKYAVNLLPAFGGSVFANSVHDLFITSTMSAGSTGLGVNDAGTRNTIYGLENLSITHK